MLLKTLKAIKFFLANLHSKEDLAREEAADACKRLAQQISDSGAVEALLRKTFDVFHGSDGKLTVVTHKISVLQVIFIRSRLPFFKIIFCVRELEI